MRAIHPALWQQCSRPITMGKIHSSNYGIPESRRHGSEVAGGWDGPAVRQSGSLSHACCRDRPLVDFLNLFDVWREEKRTDTDDIFAPTSSLAFFISAVLLLRNNAGCISERFSAALSLCGKSDHPGPNTTTCWATHCYSSHLFNSSPSFSHLFFFSPLPG